MKLAATLWATSLAACALTALVGASSPCLRAAEAPASASPARPASRAMDTNAPPMPVMKSPVETFRELLAMSPEERRTFLADRPVEYRRRLLAKIREYENLKPEDRELRLQVTELRWFLTPLLATPAANRGQYLVTIPEHQRQLLETRLEAWDRLSPESRKQLLQNEATLDYLNSLAPGNPEHSPAALTNLPPERRQKLQEGIRDWQALSESERQHILADFRQFFDLSPQEKVRTLRTLSEAERRQIERTLLEFGRLPRSTRAECLRSFEKFASLTADEQQQFLKNAERWSQMTPSERQAWKDLVYQMTPRPPLPPGLSVPGQPPPLPPNVAPRPRAAMLATNQPVAR